MNSLATWEHFWVMTCNSFCTWTSHIWTRRDRHSLSATISTSSTGTFSNEGQLSVYRYSRTAKKLWQSIPCRCTWNNQTNNCLRLEKVHVVIRVLARTGDHNLWMPIQMSGGSSAEKFAKFKTLPGLAQNATIHMCWVQCKWAKTREFLH